MKTEGVEFFEEIMKESLLDSDSDDERTRAESASRMSLQTTNRGNARSPVIYIDEVGPPKILQYQAESKKKPTVVRPSSSSTSTSTLSIDSETMRDLAGFMTDFNVHINGGTECEFCGKQTKPWPSIRDQENISNINEVVEIVLFFSFF